MNTAFNETAHPRDQGGKFAPKPASEATADLAVYDPADACDACNGSLAEDRSPSLDTTCVFCSGEADYDYPPLDDDDLSPEEKIIALADAAFQGDVDVRWAHYHAINLDDGADPETAEAMFDEELRSAGSDWDTLLARDLVTPEEDAARFNDPVVLQRQAEMPARQTNQSHDEETA